MRWTDPKNRPSRVPPVDEARLCTILPGTNSHGSMPVVTGCPSARTVFVDLPGLIAGVGGRAPAAMVKKYLTPANSLDQLLPILVVDGDAYGTDVSELMTKYLMGFVTDLPRYAGSVCAWQPASEGLLP